MNNIDQVIKEAREALAAATPGPWTVWERDTAVQVIEKHGELSICDMDGGSYGMWTLNAHLIANAPTYLTALLSEIERLRTSNNHMWECGDCGFAFDAQHVDVDDKDVPTGETTCPLCAEDEFQKENDRLTQEVRSQVRRNDEQRALNDGLIAEHAAMKEALEWYASFWNHDVQLEDVGITSMRRDRGQKARDVLSTLKCSPQYTCGECYTVFDLPVDKRCPTCKIREIVPCSP